MRWAPAGFCVLLLAVIVAAEPQATVNRKLGPLRVGNMAEDPAIWIHLTDPTKSLIFGADEFEGIYVWDLTGRLIQRVDMQQLRAESIVQIDTRNGLSLGNEVVDIVAGAMRNPDTLAVLRINPNWGVSSPPLSVLLHGASGNNAIQSEASAMTLYQDTETQNIFAFERAEVAGPIRQHLLDGSTGTLRLSLARSIPFPAGIVQGAVADDDLEFLYIVEDTRGVHKFRASPTASTAEVGFFGSGDGTASDRKGMAIYRCRGNRGYLLLLSQGNSKVKVYDRQSANAFLKTVTTAGSTEFDGIDASVYSAPGFPKGFVVVHDFPGISYNVYDWADFAGSDLIVCPNGDTIPQTCTPSCGPWSDAARQCGSRTCTRADCTTGPETKACPAACADNDRDGYGSPATNCQNTAADCNDNNAAIKPGATEVCGNGIDENCNPADDSCVETCATDRDGDGYKAEAVCGAARDCADLNAEINPGKPERCGNGLDDDCDTRSDEDCPACTPTTCDGDCDGVMGLHCGGPDCHDGNAAIRPNASEVCGNRLDDNCDQQIDAPCPVACVNPPVCDGDCDGILGSQCGGPDCHDGNAAIRTNATENCSNLIDDDCDQLLDAADPGCQACATDLDRDGSKGDPACPPSTRDCDDRNAAVKPGAAEVCGNGVDEDCQGGDAPCTAACPGNVPVGGCDSSGRVCLADRTLSFNCLLCPCPAGQGCVENACVDAAGCQPSYTCGPWTPAQCPASGRQGRTCTAANCPGAPATRTETQSCTPTSLCNNGRLDPGEDCDGTPTVSCAGLDVNLKGVLTCRDDCRIDASGCCTTAPSSSGRRGPRYPPCPTEPVSQETPLQTGPGGRGGTVGPTGPDIEKIPGPAPQESSSAWYSQPLNLAILAVIILFGLLLLREIRSSRAH